MTADDQRSRWRQPVGDAVDSGCQRSHEPHTEEIRSEQIEPRTQPLVAPSALPRPSVGMSGVRSGQPRPVPPALGPPTDGLPPPSTPPPPAQHPAPALWGHAHFVSVEPTLKKPPGRGWRRTVYEASGRRLNPGRSRGEARQAELEAQARKLLRGNYRIGVAGKGGAGKTTVAVGVGSMLASLRDEDHVVAVDADTAFGKLGSRIDPRAVRSFWDLVADRNLDTFADVRSLLGRNAAGLFVLPGESSAVRGNVLDAAVYREAVARLDRHFAVSLVDFGATMDSPVTEIAVRDLDAMIVVSSPRVDGGWAAAQTLQWMANRGLHGVLQRTSVVLNDSHGNAERKARAELAAQFTGWGHPVFEVPFDKALRPGGVIDLTHHLGRDTR